MEITRRLLLSLSHKTSGNFICGKNYTNLLDTAYYLLSLVAEDYESLRKKRVLSVPRDMDIPLGKKFLVLIHLKDNNSIIAEYEVDDFELDNHMLKVHFEPIYNSPMPIKLTDIVLLTLPTYDLDEWKEILETTFIKVSKSDFEELMRRLKL